MRTNWRRSAIAASAVIVLAGVIYFALNWQYDADIDDELTVAPPPTTTTVTSGATLGLVCTEHDKIVFDPTSGGEIACMERFSPSYGWFWRETPPMKGVHERDTSCEGQRAWSNSRTPDNYLIHCLPADISSSSPIAGPGSVWKPPANV